MILHEGMLIAYDPIGCHTIADMSDDESFAVGVVHDYDKYADCYAIDIGNEYIMATIIPQDINRNTVRVISKRFI